METREEIVSKLELIRENILGFIQARSRQVTLVNQMRTAKLIQQDEYNENTLSHKSPNSIEILENTIIEKASLRDL